MKYLTLMRHAQADWGSGLDDFNVPLTEGGRGDARVMGGVLKDEGIVPDLIICSGAVRAAETAGLLVKGMGGGVLDLRLEAELHNASASRILKEVEGVGEQVRHVMLIGHNPGMSELSSQFAGEGIELSPCDGVYFSISASSWASCEIDDGVLLKILRNGGG